MRLLFPLAILIAAVGPALPAKSPAPSVQKPVPLQADDCPGATSQWVREGRGWQLKPQRLAELPPAESYAAVYQLDESGCMVPVKFRDVRR